MSIKLGCAIPHSLQWHAAAPAHTQSIRCSGFDSWKFLPTSFLEGSTAFSNANPSGGTTALKLCCGGTSMVAPMRLPKASILLVTTELILSTSLARAVLSVFTISLRTLQVSIIPWFTTLTMSERTIGIVISSQPLALTICGSTAESSANLLHPRLRPRNPRSVTQGVGSRAGIRPRLLMREGLHFAQIACTTDLICLEIRRMALTSRSWEHHSHVSEHGASRQHFG